MDFDPSEKTMYLVDWSEVKGEGKYAKIEKKELQEGTYLKILGEFPSLYPELASASSYRIVQAQVS